MPQPQPVSSERTILIAMLAARLMDSLNALKREIGPFFKAQKEVPNVMEAKKAFWDMMAEALALVRDADLARDAKGQPKGSKG